MCLFSSYLVASFIGKREFLQNQQIGVRKGNTPVKDLENTKTHNRHDLNETKGVLLS